MLRQVVPGWRHTAAVIPTYALAWSAANEEARAAGGPMWVVLGDSTAQGIGASAYDRGYVGVVHNWLDGHTGLRWRVLNLSKSGARVSHVLAEQVPLLVLEARDKEPDLVTLAVGANDMVRRTPLPLFKKGLEAVLNALPERSVVATLPQGLGRRTAKPIGPLSLWLRSATSSSPTCGPAPGRRGGASSPPTASTPTTTATSTGRPPSSRLSAPALGWARRFPT